MSVGPILNYTLYGKQTRVFPFPPNWKTSVNETLEWKTNVLRSFSGDEQRRQLRQQPRRSFDYDILVGGDKAGMLESYLWSWHNKYFALPVWTDVGKLTSNVAIGAATLMINTVNLSYRDGDYVVIFDNPKLFEVVQVATTLVDRLTLMTNTTRAWSAGVKVFPIVVGHLSTSVQTLRHTSSVISMQINFATAPETTYSFLPSIPATTFYDGIEVVMFKPNWKNAISNDFTHLFDTVDVGVGPVGYFDREPVSRIVRSLPWTLRDRAEISEFRALMGRMAGQMKTVWLPSWHDDLVLAKSNAEEPTVLTVKGIWFNGMTGIDVQRNTLMITLPSGQIIYRKIVGMSPNYTTDTTELQLDTLLGQTVGVNDNLRLRFLMRCRLATDKIVIPWVTDTVATPQTAFTTVKL